MAQTTSTQYTTGINDMIADNVLMTSADRSVLMPYINLYSISGMRGKDSLTLNRWGDPGEAEAATEGTDFVTTAQLSLTGSTLTPTESAVAQVLITHDAVEERTGLRSVQELLNTGDEDLILAGMMAEVEQLGEMVARKREQDVTTLFSALNSGTAAGTNNSDATVADFLAGLTLLENKEGLPHNDFVCMADVEFFANLRADFLTGNYPSSVMDLANANFINARGIGPAGSVLGVPFVKFGVTARQTSTGVFSAIVLRGEGAPETEGGGLVGAFAMVEGRPLTIGWEQTLQGRATLLQANHKYIIGERVDDYGIPYETDAP